MVQVLLNSLSWACLNLLVAMSFWLLYAPTRTFYFTHAAAITFGAYGTYWLSSHVGLPVLPSAIAACIAVAMAFSALERGVFCRLRDHSRTWSGLVTSLGVYVVLQNGVSLCFGDETLVLRSSPILTSQKIGNAFLTQGQQVIIVTSMALAAGVGLLLHFSRLGREIRGVASNPELCVLLGIEPRRVSISAAAIGSCLAAITGVLLALDADLSPTLGFRVLLSGVIVMIVGGTGSVGGFAGAAILLAVAQHSAAYCFDAKWMDATAFVFLIAFLMWKPLGFDGRRLKKTAV